MLEFPGLISFDMASSPVSPPYSPPALCILSAAALMLGGGEAQAWGFGRAQSSAVLGMPLDFSVALRLDASESPPECLAADVSAGDIPVPRSAVFVSTEIASGGPVVLPPEGSTLQVHLGGSIFTNTALSKPSGRPFQLPVLSMSRRLESSVIPALLGNQAIVSSLAGRRKGFHQS